MLEGHSLSESPSEASLSGAFRTQAHVSWLVSVSRKSHQVAAASGKEGGRPAKGDRCLGCRPGWCAGIRGMRATFWRRISGTRCGDPRGV